VTGRGFTALRLDDVDEVPWKPGLSLRPIRSLLGLRAFGAAGFVAREPGDLVVEPHTEAEGRGHQELYVVLRGRARFTLDGHELDAPAGTLVAVEPHVRRQAVAVEADTAVLAFGGPPAFEPAGHEYMARVRGALDRPDEARAIAEAGLRELPDSPGARYAMALATAAAGDRDKARRWLEEAIARVPELRGETAHDPVLARLVD
jgi:mannose-6-phosphate isomerase-like protein (cupin superfamily)